MPGKVAVEALRATCDPQDLGCNTTEELSPLEAIVGQDRAVRALRFGMAIKEPGFNIYVAGLPGTGRTTAVRRFLEAAARDQPVPPDWCYVNGFDDSYRPNALSLPPGHARQLLTDANALVERAGREVRAALESEEYAARRDQAIGAFERQREQLFAEVGEGAREKGFALQVSPAGVLTIPLKDGKPISEQDLLALRPEEREAIEHAQEELQAEVKAAVRQAKSMGQDADEAASQLEQEVASFAVDPMFGELVDKYSDCPEVIAFLDNVKQDMLRDLSQFGSESEDEPAAPLGLPGPGELPFRRYQVNLLVDNGRLQGAPVVIESNPTYGNLFGQIVKEPQLGTLVTDFTLIRGGSVHRANGGYLVLPARELLAHPLSWDKLKRSLRNRQVTVEEPRQQLGYIATKSLQPEPIPLDVKVVLIGDPELYHVLYTDEQDFCELFKVKADFDLQMDRTPANIGNYASFISTLCTDEGLKHLDRSAIARIVEYGSRLAQDQTKLSTRFGDLSDVVREASFYADQEDAAYVTVDHVRRAIDERLYRSSLVRERIEETIERGIIMIDVEGKKVGQANSLVVVDMGDIAFGQPARITASVGPGRGRVVDIEREARLGGPLHAKGVMILSGYLVDKYARDTPLSLSARLVFEQSYSGVEGDSASSTELYALLSSLSGLPIVQGIAITGSVNQKGQVQAIGGVNQKIEGFYRVCEARGLTGEQGVLVPESNTRNLMLSDEVVKAVSEGRFHIWSVETIDQGIEILTGVRAGEERTDGTYEGGTVNYLVRERLKALAETMRAFGGPVGDQL